MTFVQTADRFSGELVSGGDGTVRQVLIGPDRAPNFSLRRFVMQPGGGMPRHTNTVEHEQYVLSGRARVTIADATHEVGPDDVLYIPAGTPHAYEAIGEEPFIFLCAVPNEPDEMQVVS